MTSDKGKHGQESFNLPLNQPITIQDFTFTAIKQVGRGSFGIVYKITSPEFEKPMALKLVLQDRRYKNREF